MYSITQDKLYDALDLLATFNLESVPALDAKRKIQALQKHIPSAKLELIWDKEQFDQSLHYDLLIRLPDGKGTISMSHCPERLLPWPMRGVHRASESFLLKVNNTLLTVGDAIGYLDFIWDDAGIIKRMIDGMVIRDYLERYPLSISDEEMQCVIDQFRRSHQLYTVEATEQWMQQHGITQEKLENMAEDLAILSKLRDQVTENRVDDYFSDNKADFDSVQWAQIRFAEKTDAIESMQAIKNGSLDFFELAKQRFDFSNSSNEIFGDFFYAIHRWQASSEIKEIFHAKPGDIVGPLNIRGEFSIIMLLKKEEALLNLKTRDSVKKRLFEDWITDLKQGANIHWYWGNAERLENASYR